MLDLIDNHQWCVLMDAPKSEAVFDALVARDDAAQAAGDVGLSLDALLAEWDRQHSIHDNQ